MKTESRLMRGSLMRCILVAALVLLSASVHAESYKYEEKSEQKIPIEGEKRIVIRNKRGNIDVRGESGRTEIFLEVIKRIREEEQDKATELARMMEVEVLRVRGELEIRAKYPKEDERGGIFDYIFKRKPQMEMEFIVSVPEEQALVISTASGDATVKKVLGAVEISAASGDVKAVDLGSSLEISVASGDVDVQDIKGDLSINSASGNVRGRHVEGDVGIYTASGNVRIAEITGALVLKTASGDAVVDDVGDIAFSAASGGGRFSKVTGSIKASAASGNLTFELLPSGELDYLVRSTSGNIKLNLLEEMPGGFVLKAGTTTGDISANLAIKISKVGKNHVSGVVREGRGRIVLETASGNIEIYERER